MEIIAIIAGGIFAVGLWYVLDAASNWNALKAAIGIFCFVSGFCGIIYVNRQAERAETARKMFRGEYSVEYATSNDTIIILK